MKIKPTAALRASLLSPDSQVVENARIILEDREQAMEALVAIAAALDEALAARPVLFRPVRRICVICRCLLLNDRRCPGCDAKVGRRFARKVG